MAVKIVASRAFQAFTVGGWSMVSEVFATLMIVHENETFAVGLVVSKSGSIVMEHTGSSILCSR